MGDKIGVLNRGKLVQVGTPSEVYANPRTTFVARAVGTPPMNLLRGTLVDGKTQIDGENIDLPVTAKGGAEGQKLTFGIRPEDLQIVSGAPVRAKVFDIENHGVVKILTLEVGAIKLHATVPARMKIALDEQVQLGWKADKVLLFDQATGINLTATE